MRCDGRPARVGFWTIVALCTCSAAPWAQISTDGTVGPATDLAGPDFTIGEDLGRLAGANLFHSFRQFNLGSGESAIFSGPDSVENVISRVTGGTASSVDGQISSTMPVADFFLINPAGVVFGPNASLDVGGSFFVSTADTLRFADGDHYSAIEPGSSSSFSVAAPEAFGFLSDTPGAITSNGSNLRVPFDQNITIAGGELRVNGGSIDAPRGNLFLTSLASRGEVSLASGATDAERFGKLMVTNGLLEVDGNGAGDLHLRGGEITISDARLRARNFGDRDARGAITLTADSIVIDDSSLVADVFFDGAGAGLRLEAEEVRILGRSSVGATAFDGGSGGEIAVTAARLVIDGEGILLPAGILSLADASSSGEGSSIVIHAGQIEILNGGQIASTTLGDGDAGSIDVSTTGLVVVGDDANRPTGISSQSGLFANGDAGSITVNSEDIVLRFGGQVSSSAEFLSAGNAGDISITTDELSAHGEGAAIATGVLSTADPGSLGNAGSITIDAVRITLRDGALVSSNTFSDGMAGDVTLQADRIFLAGDGSQLDTGVFSQAGALSRGNAGTVMVDADDVEIRDGAAIAVNSGFLSSGNAGALDLTAGRLFISGDGSPFVTGIIGRLEIGSEGAGGSLTLNLGDLEIRDGGVVTSTTFGLGDAGAIVVAADSILVSGDGAGVSTGIISQADQGSLGNGGRIAITAPLIELRQGGAISTATLALGDGGSIEVTSDRLTIAGDGEASLLTGISSGTAEDSLGDGGRIGINAAQLIILPGGTISSQTQGAGRGGDIDVASADLEVQGDTSPFFTGLTSRSEATASGPSGSIIVVGDILRLTEGATISAASFGKEGDAGDIRVVASRNLIMNADAAITTQTDNTNGGNIRIEVVNLIDIQDAQVTTAVRASDGVGGDIFIDPAFVVLDESVVQADAFAGNAGNITLVAENIVQSANSAVTASSELAVDGTITIEAPETDITADLAVLTAALIDATALLQQRCAARAGRSASSLVRAGRGGLPLDPEQPQSAPYLLDKPLVPPEQQKSAWPQGQAVLLAEAGRPPVILVGDCRKFGMATVLHDRPEVRPESKVTSLEKRHSPFARTEP